MDAIVVIFADMRNEQMHDMAGRNLSLYHIFAQRYSNIYQHYANSTNSPYKNIDGRLLDPSHLAYQFSSKCFFCSARLLSVDVVFRVSEKTEVF